MGMGLTHERKTQESSKCMGQGRAVARRNNSSTTDAVHVANFAKAAACHENACRVEPAGILVHHFITNYSFWRRSPGIAVRYIIKEQITRVGESQQSLLRKSINGEGQQTWRCVTTYYNVEKGRASSHYVALP